MTPQPIACPQCNTPVSTGGGRCPSCGFELPPLEPSPSGIPHAMARRPPPPRRTKGSPGAIALTAVLGVAATGLVIWRLRMGDSSEQVSATSSSLPTPPPPVSVDTRPPLLEPTTIYSDAKKRALTWDREALLVDIHAHGVVDRGQIDTRHDGAMDIAFGKASGAKLLAGERVGRERFVVHADANGITTRQEQAKTGAVAAGDPNCTLDAAWSKAVAAGLPSTRAMDVQYAWDPKRARSVWRASSGADAAARRTLDGWNCAIVVR